MLFALMYGWETTSTIPIQFHDGVFGVERLNAFEYADSISDSRSSNEHMQSNCHHFDLLYVVGRLLRTQRENVVWVSNLLRSPRARAYFESRSSPGVCPCCCKPLIDIIHKTAEELVGDVVMGIADGSTPEPQRKDTETLPLRPRVPAVKAASPTGTAFPLTMVPGRKGKRPYEDEEEPVVKRRRQGSGDEHMGDYGDEADTSDEAGMEKDEDMQSNDVDAWDEPGMGHEEDMQSDEEDTSDFEDMRHDGNMQRDDKNTTDDEL